MKASLNWLKRYVAIPEPHETLARDLTMFGLNVEGIETLSPPFRGVVFGKVLDVVRHPQADRLSLCTVDAGSGDVLRIVCGAPNVRAGQSVAVALPGAVLAGGLTIKKTKIRGEVSEGMICSEIELGIGQDADGIIELDFEDRPGTDLAGKLGYCDVILDVEVTPNRPDQLCHIGIAREIAALYKRELRIPEPFCLNAGHPFTVEIENEADCPRYSAGFVYDAVIEPSPDWMQQLLSAVGIKPINNIVDVTNFVLLEMGQPLHAFDLDALGRTSILVRRALGGERLVTLDGVQRDLDSDVLVITDGHRPVALAGIMGGKDTEVRSGTKRILLESAMFDPRVVRAGSRRLRLETEASYRFEREGDVGATRAAVERACRMIEEIGAGRPAAQYAEALSRSAPVDERILGLRVKQVNRVMGTRLTAVEVASLLERLQLRSRDIEKSFQVLVPTFRRDLRDEIDLIEEVARVYGYENLGREEVRRATIFAEPSLMQKRYRDVCGYLASRGLAEVVTSSFMDPQDPQRLGWDQHDPRSKPVRISNPLTVAQSTLRTSLVPGLLAVVRRNVQSDQEGIRIFELGKIFLRAGEGGGLPVEELHLTAAFARKANPVQWIAKQRPVDYFDMKGELEGLLQRLGIIEAVRMVKRDGTEETHIFNWLLKKKLIAEGGLIPGSVRRSFDLDTPVFYFDLLIGELPEPSRGGPRFTHVSPYPEVKRDLCLVAGERVTFAEIRSTIIARSKNLETIRLFDYYRGERLGEGKRSYTFRLSFRSLKGTLADRDVDKEMESILTALQRELQVTLRTE